MSKIIVKEFWQDPKKRQIVIWAVVLCALYFLVPLFFTQTKKPVVINEKDNGTELFSVAEVSQMEEKKTKEMFDQLAADSQNRELAAFAQENRLKDREKKIEMDCKKVTSEKTKKEILDNRNLNWIKIMPELMEKETVFFAVGSAHLGGEFGVINLLKKAGYIVKPVMN